MASNVDYGYRPRKRYENVRNMTKPRWSERTIKWLINTGSKEKTLIEEVLP